MSNLKSAPGERRIHSGRPSSGTGVPGGLPPPASSSALGLGSGVAVSAGVAVGVSVGVLVGDAIYTWMALRLARRTGRTDVTAMPLGLDTPSTFGEDLRGRIYVASLDGPVFRLVPR